MAHDRDCTRFREGIPIIGLSETRQKKEENCDPAHERDLCQLVVVSRRKPVLLVTANRKVSAGSEPSDRSIGTSEADIQISCSKRQLRADCVEKLRLSETVAADSLPLRQGRSGDDGTEASGAGRTVLRVLDRGSGATGSSVESHGPVLRSRRHASASRAILQLDGPALGRSGTDDPDADRWLCLRYPVGAAALRGGASQPGVSLVLSPRSDRSGARSLDLLKEPTWAFP